MPDRKNLFFNSGVSDGNGNLWMTTYRDGVWKYNGESLSNFKINNGTEDVLLVSIYQDHNGTIWLGTENDGSYYSHGNDFNKFIPAR